MPERNARCVQNYYLTIAKSESDTLTNPARSRGGKCVCSQVLLCAGLGSGYFPCAKAAWSLITVFANDNVHLLLCYIGHLWGGGGGGGGC